MHDIMQTCPCIKDPLTHHLDIVKLGLTEVYTFYFALKHRLWVLVRTASVITRTLCFELK